MHCCGRQYEPGGGELTRAELLKGVHKIDDMPGWLNSGEIWSGAPCRDADGVVTTGVFVRGDGDRFKSYSLLGGP